MVTSGDVVPMNDWMVVRNVSPKCGPNGKNQIYATNARTVPVAVENLIQSFRFCTKQNQIGKGYNMRYRV